VDRVGFEPTTSAMPFTSIWGQMNWMPQNMWTYTGGDYTVAIGSNNVGVFAETSKMDLNELSRMLAK
jgi:roadblock/LC7 domain-containing protein